VCRPTRGLLLVLLALSGACISLAQHTAPLRIAAAADLQPVLPAIVTAFEQQTNEKVVASYASSATLTTQILNGAPYGLFLAADESFPQRVVAAGLAESAQPIPYARGTLVLWARKDSPAQPLSLDSLRKPALRTVAVANAEHAPYGRAAASAIAKLGLADALKGKLVVAENIAQTAEYADSGNAQAGFLSLTAALTPRLRASGTFIEIPASAYPPLLQGAVVMKQGPSVDEARRFLAFLLSPPVRRELAERGLKAP
jgi:molybdate transport system substrate-binding protein